MAAVWMTTDRMVTRRGAGCGRGPGETPWERVIVLGGLKNTQAAGLAGLDWRW